MARTPVRTEQDARRRAPDEATILRVAAELFAERGYRATTMDGLAEALRITKPTLYVHGRSKSDILERIIDSFIAEADRRLDDAMTEVDGTEWVTVFLRSWIEIAVEMSPHLHAYLNLRHELAPEANRKYARWSKNVDKRVQEAVASSQAAGHLRADVDPAVIAFAFLALSNWTARWFSVKGPLTLDQITAGYVTTVLDGLRA